MSSITSFSYGNSPYGNFRTPKFTDVWDTAADFSTDYLASSLNPNNYMTTADCNTLYYLLYARYGNSNIASTDTNQFKYKVYATIYQYGPTWKKRLEVQNTVRTLTEDELLSGSKQIYNHSYNPSTAPSTDTIDELTTINEQNVNKARRGKMDAYAFLMELLDSDVTEEFLSKFKKYFLQIVNPYEPLWYETDLEDN